MTLGPLGTATQPASNNIAISEAIGSDAFHSRDLAGAYLEGGVGEPSGTTLSQPLAQFWTCG
jgi:hypothetical protein